MIQKTIIQCCKLLIILFIISCGGSVKVRQQGVFLDTYVAGFRYQCDDLKGVTNMQGRFVFHEDTEFCYFRLGVNQFVASKLALADRVVTPYEVTKTLDAAVNLARVIQSFAKEQDDVLVLDIATSDRLGRLDLTNANQVASQIKAVGGNLKSIEETKAHLGKNFDLTTGNISSGNSKPNKPNPLNPPTDPDTSNPVPCLPGQTCDDGPGGSIAPSDCLPGAVCLPDNNTTKPLPPIPNNCPPGEKCTPDNNGSINSVNSKPCLPGQECGNDKKPITDRNICFPGTDCDDSDSSSVDCLPGQDCNTPTGSNSGNTCLPGADCNTKPSKPNNGGSGNSCLPGVPCGGSNRPSGIKPSSGGSNSGSSGHSGNTCLPGKVCQDGSQQSSNNKPSTPSDSNNRPPSPNNNNNGGTCLPGQVC